MRCFSWNELGVRRGLPVVAYKDGLRVMCESARYMMLSANTPPNIGTNNDWPETTQVIEHAHPVPFNMRRDPTVIHHALAQPDPARLAGELPDSRALIRATTRLIRTPARQHGFAGVTRWRGASRVYLHETATAEDPVTHEQYSYTTTILECSIGATLQVILPDMFSTRVFLRYNGQELQQLCYEDLP